jgi:regulator of sigma E protease
MVVLRDGAEVELVVTPRKVEREDRFGNRVRYGELGVSRAGVTLVRHGPLIAVWAASRETVRLTAVTLRAVGQMISGSRPTDELGGPVRIAQMAGQVAEDGIITVFWFMALLSINLGLINLFPIPMLDGGHLLFYAFEAVRGKPLGERAQEYGFRVGLALVLTLMVFATWNDLVQLRVVDFFFDLLS